ncbi:MAG: hypothetical protein RIG61_04750 [Deltaproteobacteria bacterium]
MVKRTVLFSFLIAVLGFCICGVYAYDASAQGQENMKAEIQQLKQMMGQMQGRMGEMQSRIDELEQKNIMLEQQAQERAEAAVIVEETSVTEKTADEPFGGEFAVTIGAQTGPFKTGTGFYLSAELGVPLYKNLGPGKLLGIMSFGWARTDDDITFEPTVNAIAPGTLPTQTSVNLDTATILLGLKYKLEAHRIVQPFVLGGPSMNLFFNESDPGSQVGGIAPQPNILQKRGFPSGQGNAELGITLGGGVDFNVTHKIFVGAQGLFNWVDRDNGAFGTYGGRLGFRF